MDTRKTQGFRLRGSMVAWGLLALLAVGVAIFAVSPYLTFNSSRSLIPINPIIPPHYLLVAVHAITGATALIIGPFQFLSRFRARYPRVHRVIGRIYLISVGVGSITAFGSALASTSGFVAQTGFAFLAIIWFYSALQAYRAIRQKNIQLHRLWMIRNYTLTSAAIVLRLWLGIGVAILAMTGNLHGKVTSSPLYVTAAWISWVAPLVITEWFINQRYLRSGAPLKEENSSEKQSKAVSKSLAPSA